MKRPNDATPASDALTVERVQWIRGVAAAHLGNNNSIYVVADEVRDLCDFYLAHAASGAGKGGERWHKAEGDQVKGRDAMKSGAELIADERNRQIKVEGWTPEHDDGHDLRELHRAAFCYCDPTLGEEPVFSTPRPREDWPWDMRYWKPSEDPIRNLVKAGALIAAEIDRLQRSAKE